MKVRIIFNLIIVCLVAPLTYGQTASFKKAVQAKLQQYGRAEGLAAATWSFGLWDVKTGQAVATIRPQMLMTPASTLKAFTTAAMLDKYGPDYRYQTKINLYPDCIALEGSGDPSLGSAYFDQDPNALMSQWASKVADAKPDTKPDTKLDTKPKDTPYLIANLDCFEPNLPDSYTWGDMGNYYGAGPRAINWQDNTTKLEYEAGKLGALATLKSVYPKPYNDVDWRSNVTYGRIGTGDNAYVYGTSTDKVRLISGTIPAGGKNSFMVKAAMPEPELVLLAQLQRVLDARQVMTTKSIYTTNIWSRSYKPLTKAKVDKVLLTYESPPLAALVAKTNQFSLNHYADAFLLKLADDKGSKQATIADGLESLGRFAAKMGVPKTGFYVLDGSGLSPANAISAQAFGTFLLAATEQKWFVAFDTSLAVAGKIGTMKDQCLSTAAVGNLHVKTGSLTRVQNYVGYFKGKDGRMYAVALMVNRYTISYGAMRKISNTLLADLVALDPK